MLKYSEEIHFLLQDFVARSSFLIIGDSRMRQLFNAFADMTSRSVIYEWTVSDVTSDARSDVVRRGVAYDVDYLKLTNAEVERIGDGGLQRSFCAFESHNET